MNRWTRFFLIPLIMAAVFVSGGCGGKFSLPEARLPEPSRILDREGRVMATVSGQNRIPVAAGQISPSVLDAIVAIEDARYYEHHGIDPVGLGRALYRNIRAGRIIEGGSTITQQLAKNLYLGPERTVERKLKELVLTIQLERKYSKTEILVMYLNQIYFGQGAYGIEMASRTYFGKSAGELDLAESSMLAGIPRAPSVYSPAGNYQAAKQRQRQVLERMAELGYIDAARAEKTAGEKLVIKKAGSDVGKTAFFTNVVQEYIRNKHPELAESMLAGGYDIETTFDLDMQKAGEEALSAGLEDKDRELEGALVAVEPATGEIRVMVGGRDPGRSALNRAVTRSQPGSAFKPFLYAAALEDGYTAASTLVCGPVEFPQAAGPPYRPEDYEGGYHNRPFTLKEALMISDNVVAVKLNEQVGPQRVVSCAKRMGVESPLRPYLSLALGTSEVTPLEMAAAFACLANQGISSKPYFISRIKDPAGKVLDENFPSQKRAIDEKTAYIVTDMLSGVLQPGGTASGAGDILRRPAAGKTGTTENYREAWFVGYTPELSAAVYVGYDSKNKNAGAAGGVLAAPIWAHFTAKALEGRAPGNFTAPPGIVMKKVCRRYGLLALPDDDTALEAAFVEGTEPALYCLPLYGAWDLWNREGDWQQGVP